MPDQAPPPALARHEAATTVRNFLPLGSKAWINWQWQANQMQFIRPFAGRYGKSMNVGFFPRMMTFSMSAGDLP
jgi:hypothetical protein